jgi:ribonuclease R
MKPLPSRAEILDWVRANPGAASRREIARAFGLKGAARLELKELLRRLEAEGALSREHGGFRDAGVLPPVAVLVVEAPDGSGDLFARPEPWKGAGEPPRLLLLPGRGDAAPGAGDRVLARIGPETEAPRTARIIRRIGTGPARILGLYRRTDRGGRIEPVDRRTEREWIVPPGEAAHAADGELVEAEALPGTALGLGRARVLRRLGDPSSARSVSLIAIHQHGLPVAFPPEALAEAAAAGPDDTPGREDLRALPLVTIDPEDARDHDDAVAAMADADPANPGGWVVWVAIADVAAHVAPGSALDREARNRGNSTYFPDRVVPMLPERLSADLCSLLPGVDRPCLAVRLVLDAEGRKRGHSFHRGIMRSAANLTYEAAQAAADGRPDDATAPLLDSVIRPLWGAYAAAARARDRRNPLDLDLPERRILLSPEGRVVSVAFRERLVAHRLIEEFMILANVAAAEALEAARAELLYRVHEEPSPEKIEALREIAEGCGLVLARGQVLKTAHFNRLLADAARSDFAEMLNMSVLRTQTQAYYSPRNLGHFGLNLARYAHFTSPIRRYADLVVHRALIAAYRFGPGGLTPAEAGWLEQTAAHVSMTERRSMQAERDTADRYLAAWMADRVGSEFAGRVSGVARFGLFVRLDGTGAEGLVPVASLGREYFHHDAASQSLTGEQTGRRIALGDRCTVRLAEAVAATGGLLFELLEVEGRAAPRPAPGRRNARPRRGLARAKVKARRPPRR